MDPTPVTLDSISSLETKLLARFDELRNELLNVKNIIIKNLQEENKSLWKIVSFLDKKVISLQSRHKMLEQYWRRSNKYLWFCAQKDLENKVVGIINAIGANVSNDDFQDCHGIEKSWNISKKKQLLDSPTEKLLKTLCITERN